MRRHLTMALLCAAAGWAAPAAAQGTQIYRCGTTYSQQPCAEGRLVAASDSRSATQKAQTDAATKRDAKAAAAMEKDRLKEEARPVPVGLPAPKQEAASASEKKAPSKTNTKAKGKKPEDFTAVAPKKPDEEPVKKKAKKTDA